MSSNENSARVNCNRADGVRMPSDVNPSAIIVSREFSPKADAPMPMSIEEMAGRLGDAGFSFSKTAAARFILGRISYQHVSDYVPLFDSGSCDIRRDVRSLYLIMKFDRMFQAVLMEYIGLFEHQLRSQYSLELSLKHGAFAHRDPGCFVNQGYFDKYLVEYKRVVKDCYRRNRSRAKRDIDRYGVMPVWEAFEEMPLGMVSKLYMNTADAGVKRRVAKSFDTRPRDFESKMSSLAFVRNRCAHFGKLVGETLVRRPPKLKYVESDNENPFHIVLVLMNLLRTNNNLGEMSLIPSATLAANVADLFVRNKGLLKTARIPDNWFELIRDPNVSGLDIQFPNLEGAEAESREIRASKLGLKMT